ncbi:MAG: cation:proton antiporter subunit C [Pseudomonadota bacterium]
MVEFVLERGNYWAIIGLMMIGLFIAFSAGNLIKRLIGLGVFQTSIILIYVSFSRIDGGTAPILFGADYGKDKDKETDPAVGLEAGEATGSGYDSAYQSLENVYSNPLPHVLMLTAIVVGVATLAVGLAIIVRIREAYGTIEADKIAEMDREVAMAQAADEADERASVAGAGTA